MAVFVKSVLEEQIDRYLVIDSMANYTLIHQTHDSYTEVFIPGAQLFAPDSTIIFSLCQTNLNLPKLVNLSCRQTLHFYTAL